MSSKSKLLRSFVGVLLFISNIHQVDSCDTNNGWADVENKCYRHFDQQLSWEAARTSCRQLNGDLIVITSGTVVNILQDTFVNITTSFWIGLRDQNGANNLADYRWTDGASLTSYTNWASGQPSNTNQRCVTADPQWSWFDESCTQLASYMCQKNQAVVNILNRATITQQENQRTGNVAVQLSENVIANNVSVTCRVSNAASDITNLVFGTILIPPGSNSGSLSYSISSPGQAATITCSAQSIGGTQFLSNTSVGLTGSIRVVKAARADFCSDVVVVPVTGAGTARIELSESVADNPVVITCNTVSSNTAQVTFVQQNVAIGIRIASISYTVSSQDLGDAYVICTAQSSNAGTQFLTATSASRNATFRIQLAALSLIPTYNNMYRSNLTLYLTVNIPIPSAEFAAIFTCCISNYSETGNQDLASCTNQIASSIVQANGTLATVSLSQSTIAFQSGEYFKTLNVITSPAIDRTWKQLFSITCSSGSSTTNPRYAGLNATAYINLDLSPIVPENITTGSILTNVNPAFTDIAPCPCNLQVNFCDPNCCCDSDCTASDIATFTTCLRPFVVRPLEHDCRAIWPDKQDYEALMCVAVDNNPLLGFFYSIRSAVTSVSSFNTLVTASRAIYSYRESELQSFSGQVTNTVSYQYGIPIVLDISGGLSGYLALPSQIIGGCTKRGLVRYLINSNSHCTQLISNSLCTPTSTWSAVQYLMSRSLSFPPCPISDAVKKLFTGATVASATVNYYCLNDISPYITNGQSATNNNPANLRRCNFDDGRTRPPTPLLDSTSSLCNNVVTKVDYKIYWNGPEIDRIIADVIMGSVPLTSSSTSRRKSTLTQQFSVQFIHNTTVLPMVSYSGNPGYLKKYPVLFAINQIGGGSSNSIVSTGAYLWRWSPSSNGLCDSSSRVDVTFGNDEISGCTLSLSIADFQDCAALRDRVKILLDGSISADYVGKRGNSSDTLNNDWLSIIKEDPVYTNNLTSNPSVISGSCSEIPAALNVTFLTAQVRTAPIGQLEWEIVGAQIRYNLEDWDFICGTGGAYGCSSQVNDTTSPTSNSTSATLTFSSRFKPFIVKVFTTFIEVPAIQQTNEPLSAERDREISKKCCSDILYPFSLTNFDRLARDRALGFMMMLILLLIGGVAITKPWI